MAYQRNYVGAFIGLAGAGKSVSLAEVGLKEMLKGRRVWSNLPIEIKKGTAIYNRKTFYGMPIQEKQTEPLDMNLIYLLDEELLEGTILIDEAGYFADSRQSGSVKNRLINGCIRQLRHRQLNLFYSAFDFFRVDNRLRDETDFIVECSDLTNTPWGDDISVDDGVFIIRRFYDKSGKVTRGRCCSPYYPKDKVPYKVEQFTALPYWYCYNTYKSQDLEEAFSKVQLDLVTHISNRGNGNEASIEQERAIASKIEELKEQGQNTLKAHELDYELSQIGLKRTKAVRSILTSRGVFWDAQSQRFVLTNSLSTIAASP